MGEAVTACEVLVIGAGPGGGNAALHSARAGLSTILIEDHEEIGTPVHCGECISDVACDNLNLDLPDHVISKRVHGIRVIFPDGTEKKLTEEGYVLEKHLFERWIADEAVSQGATLSLNHKLTSMEKMFDGQKFIGWRCEGKGEQFPIEAKIVIDASGVAGVCSKILELNPRPQVIAGMQYEMLDVPTDDYLDFYIWPKYAEKGYVWMIPKCDGRANVGLVSEDKSRTKKGLDEFIEATHFKDLEQVAPPWKKKGNPAFGGTIPISGPHENTHADGLMLVGDAAGFTSPLFEGGSHLALKSALFDLSDDDMSLMAQCFPDEMSNMGPHGKLAVCLKILIRRPGLYARKIIPAMLSFGYSRAKYYGW